MQIACADAGGVLLGGLGRRTVAGHSAPVTTAASVEAFSLSLMDGGCRILRPEPRFKVDLSTHFQPPLVGSKGRTCPQKKAAVFQAAFEDEGLKLSGPSRSASRILRGTKKPVDLFFRDSEV